MTVEAASIGARNNSSHISTHSTRPMLETLAQFGWIRKTVRHNLDGNGGIELPIADAIDFSCSSDAERCKYSEGLERR